MGKLSGIAKALDMSKAARMRRATDQGFNTRVWYHGTNQDIDAFSHSFGGDVTRHPSTEGAVFLSDTPEHASQYADLAASTTRRNKREIAARVPEIQAAQEAASRRGDWAEYERLGEIWEELELGEATRGGQNVMPLLTRTNRTYVWDVTDSGEDMLEAFSNARAGGYDSVLIRNTTDTPYGGVDPGEHLAVFDTSNLRSVNAAFDPDNIGSSDILGAATPAAVGAAGVSGAVALFVQKRAQQGSPRARQMLEAAATIGTGIVGGLVESGSKLGGALMPWRDPVQAREAARAAAESIQYIPSGQNPYLEAIGREIGVFEEDVRRGFGPAIDTIEGIYQRVPERAKLLIEGGSEVLF